MPSIHEADTLVVGGGPAGIAASCMAAEAGQRVLLVDSSPAIGGQIWRQASAKDTKAADTWRARWSGCGAHHLPNAEVIGLEAPNTLRLARADQSAELVRYRQLIVATGARELFLPLPGWTLPGFFGAGGLQALVKSGFPVSGKRVVVAGSGPLLFAVAATLHRYGADVRLIAEQAPWTRVARFAMYLLRSHLAKFGQAVQLRRALQRVPFYSGVWLRSILGNERVEGVVLTDGQEQWVEPCDYVACGFGLVPNLELPMLMGCAIAKGRVVVDAYQQSSAEQVFCAGESTGIAGAEAALIEGQIAGWAASGRHDRAQRLFSQRRRYQRFAAHLDATFSLRSELRSLAEPSTFVCRCEDVSWARLRAMGSWREAKLLTRCGMGPCQGRVCGPACEFLFGWNVDSVRPPVFPCLVKQLTE